jgi:hypothetical protein
MTLAPTNEAIRCEIMQEKNLKVKSYYYDLGMPCQGVRILLLSN